MLSQGSSPGGSPLLFTIKLSFDGQIRTVVYSTPTFAIGNLGIDTTIQNFQLYCKQCHVLGQLSDLSKFKCVSVFLDLPINI